MPTEHNELKMTTVTGYYNPFDFPVFLDLTELNSKVTLGPRQFICKMMPGKKETDPKIKVKVNDPIFEQFVKAKQLQREEGKELVPILFIPRAQIVTQDQSESSVGVSKNIVTNHLGDITHSDKAKVSPQSEGSSAESIKVYSIAGAKKAGLIPKSEPGRIPEEKEIALDKEVPMHSRPQALPPLTPKAPLQPDNAVDVHDTGPDTEEILDIDEGLDPEMKLTESQVSKLTANIPKAPAAAEPVKIVEPPPQISEKTQDINVEPLSANKVVKALKKSTGASSADCKKALAESNGDVDKATSLIKDWQASPVDDKKSLDETLPEAKV